MSTDYGLVHRSPLIDAELVESVYSSYVEPLAAKFPAVWPKDQVSLGDFRWAYSVVSSRFVRCQPIRGVAIVGFTPCRRSHAPVPECPYADDDACVCARRAFTIGDGHEPTLLPVIDMANHDADDPAARIEKTEAGEFQVRAMR